MGALEYNNEEEIFMYTATVTVGANATGLRTLVNTASAGEIPATFNGRAFQVILLTTVGTVVLSSKGDTSPPAPPPAGNGVTLIANVPVDFQAPTGNQISIDEIFLSGVGTVGVMILVL
jgi:hypothetical protein